MVPGPKALLPLPQRRDSLLLAFPVLLIPEALSFYFVSKIKWNPTIGGRLPDCLLFGVKGLASRKGGGGQEPDTERPAAAVMAATIASLALLAAQPSAILNIFPASCSPRRWSR